MKTTIPFATFDLQSLLNTVADFTDAVCGEEFQAATLATEAELDELFDQDWNILPRFQREERFPELEKKLTRGETLVLAIASPYVGEPVDFVDGSKYKLGEDDFLVWNRDDVAAYELAVVADDMAMGITEVVRGADLLTSTSRQILLYEALGSRPPAFFPVRSYATKKVGDSPSARADFPFANSVKLAKPQRKF